MPQAVIIITFLCVAAAAVNRAVTPRHCSWALRLEGRRGGCGPPQWQSSGLSLAGSSGLLRRLSVLLPFVRVILFPFPLSESSHPPSLLRLWGFSARRLRPRSESEASSWWFTGKFKFSGTFSPMVPPTRIPTSIHKKDHNFKISELRILTELTLHQDASKAK